MPGPARRRVRHVTRYRYSAPVVHSILQLTLHPLESERQRLASFRISSNPEATFSRGDDIFGNQRHLLTLYQPHDSLEITADSVIETAPSVALPQCLSMDAWDEMRDWRLRVDYWPYTHDSAYVRPSEPLEAFIRRNGLDRPQGDPLTAMRQLARTIHDEFAYTPDVSVGVAPPERTLTTGEGVCQDYAHVMIAVARRWGLPCRYVSGYLYGLEGDDVVNAAASHAWVDCLLPELGWVGIDPTNDVVEDERHMRLAVGRDYDDVAPVKGVMRGGGSSTLEVEVQITPLGDV